MNEVTPTAREHARWQAALVDEPPLPQASLPGTDLKADLERGVRASRRHLLDLQHRPGYWCSEIGADTTIVADYVMFGRLLDRVDPTLERRAVFDLLDRQCPDGGWNMYAGGPSEINATVKGWFALKLVGFGDTDPRIRAARETILRLG
ncbi:MAG: hypothetical protein JXP34_07995, partial [Planctomycetes bacterium]|nr:hypothetical protein [Planctomycetota bacterium]